MYEEKEKTKPLRPIHLFQCFLWQVGEGEDEEIDKERERERDVEGERERERGETDRFTRDLGHEPSHSGL